MRLLKMIVTLMLALQASNAWGWAKKGHELVAQIAMHYVKPQTNVNVRFYLQNHTPEETATWMDDIKGQRIYPFMNRWHYVNIERGQAYTGADSPNVVTQLRNAFQYLRRPAREQTPGEILLQLRVLYHLTGDLHQPLHAGYGSDKGGNKVQVRMGNRGTNLHHVWDDAIIAQQNISLDDCLALGKSLSPAAVQRIAQVDVLRWMIESRGLLGSVYDFKDHRLDEGYMSRNGKIVTRQLLYAGIRLAAMLDQAFNKRVLPPPIKAQAETAQMPGVLKAYPPAAAPGLIGEKTRICGRIAYARAIDGGKGMMYFFESAQKPSPFALVIFHKDYAKFSFDPELDLHNRSVCVTGFIKNYKGQAEIIVRHAKQLELR